MEGINPTLAFLALILGFSGNARDGANDPAVDVELEQSAGCPILMITGDPPLPASHDKWADAFWNDAFSASILPNVRDPKWADTTSHKIEGSEAAGDLAMPAHDHGSDPIVRRVVPAGTNLLAADAERDPC